MVRLCELVETWIKEQVATEVEIPTTDIENILRTLQRSSSIPRIKLIRFQILLNDIFDNRYPVTKIDKRMNDALSHPNPTEISGALKGLYIEELISEEQYDALSEDDNLNLDKVI